MKPITGLYEAKLFTLGSREVTMATIVAVATVLAITFALSALLSSLIRRALRNRGITGTGGFRVAGRLVNYAIIVTGFSVAMQTIGVPIGTLFTAGAVFAVGLGFAMQNIAQNFVSGVILLIERTIKPGDILEIEGTVVRVDEMGIRSTLVRTRDEEEMIVPNSILAQGTVKNFTLRDSVYRLRVLVGVSYESDMKLVRRTLEDLSNKLTFSLPNRPPQILMLDFGASSVDWEVAIWTLDPWAARINQSHLRTAIWEAFRDKKITIAFPQLDVHFDRPVPEGLSRVA
jgi:small-conductance mechanosensitive channel